VAPRKALKAMAAEPTQPRVRAEALVGLIGALTSPTDGSSPVTASERWEFIGDVALPIDRDISHFACTRAGKIPNALQKMFQVLRPGRSKRGGLVGVVLTCGGQMLFGQPGDVAEAEPPQAILRSAAPPLELPPAPNIAVAPPSPLPSRPEPRPVLP
jgi:hypothetical protein